MIFQLENILRKKGKNNRAKSQNFLFNATD